MTLPAGTITFLFTDIEGSTRLWEQHPEQMRLALARHDALLREIIETHEGHIFKTIGDAFCAAFDVATDGLIAALEVQRRLLAEPWPDDVLLRVRMALHAGAAEHRDDDYFGPPLNGTARLLAAGHGGQTLVSAAVYELVRDHLPLGCDLNDLGIHRLKDLDRSEKVYQLTHPDLPDAFPPLRSLDNTPNNLPRQLTSFVGREREMADVRALLAGSGLLTLTGAGGSGKTRLALQAAAEILTEYPDGVWLADLAPLTDATLMARAVAQALGVPEQPGQAISQTLIESLKHKHLLLLLDNCEHLLAPSAHLAASLLRSCHNLRILATSREPLGIAGEQIYHVPPLSLPDPKRTSTATLQYLRQYEAVRLFMERAALVKPVFTVTDQNAPALAQACLRLDGIPLAIELAAARVRSLSIEDINDRLDNRFRLLTGGDCTALPRQQTLKALVDWSYDLLTEPEKILLARLSIFAGGWTLAAAESICGFEPIEGWEVLELLTSLVDKSLVLAEEAVGGIRYRMLETIRQYGAERFEDASARERMRIRHRDWFLAFVQEAEPHLRGPEPGRWLDGLETEHDNLRAALEWCTTEDETQNSTDTGTEIGLRLASALGTFWKIRGHYRDGQAWLNRFLAASGAARDEAGMRTRGAAWNWAGTLAYDMGDLATAHRCLEQSIRLYREIGAEKSVASVTSNRGNIAYQEGDYPLARRLYTEVLEFYRKTEDTLGIASLLGNLGNVAHAEGDLTEALRLQEESLRLSREGGDARMTAYTLHNLGRIAANLEKDPKRARAFYEESLVAKRALGDRRGVATLLNDLTFIALGEGKAEEASLLLTEALQTLLELGNRPYLVNSLVALAWLVSLQGNPERAARLWAAASAARRQLNLPPYEENTTYVRLVSEARAAASPATFDAAWEEGSALALDEAIRHALAHLDALYNDSLALSSDVGNVTRS